MKVDVCMWAKNGARFLPHVLKRIDKVISEDNIIQKIFVDDDSSDGTVQIAKEFNWTVYRNKLGYVAGGVKEALRHVKTDCFVSVEQDVILSKEWFEKIPPYMEKENVGVACGVRFPTHPVLRAISKSMYVHEKDASKGTLDNTIYRTKVIRRVGIPFSSIAPLSVDRYLHPLILKTGYKWILDKTVISDHIRTGLIEEERHKTKLSRIAKHQKPIPKTKALKIALTSPFRGLQIARESKMPLTTPYYVYQRLQSLKRSMHA